MKNALKLLKTKFRLLWKLIETWGIEYNPPISF